MRWRGREVEDRVIRAAKLGIDATTAQMVKTAKRIHTWKNRTGLAEGSIRMTPAEVKSDGSIVGEFGSFGVEYFIWLELGSSTQPARPSLRPAFDQEAPNLVDNIRKAWDSL